MSRSSSRLSSRASTSSPGPQWYPAMFGPFPSLEAIFARMQECRAAVWREQCQGRLILQTYWRYQCLRCMEVNHRELIGRLATWSLEAIQGLRHSEWGVRAEYAAGIQAREGVQRAMLEGGQKHANDRLHLDYLHGFARAATSYEETHYRRRLRGLLLLHRNYLQRRATLVEQEELLRDQQLDSYLLESAQHRERERVEAERTHWVGRVSLEARQCQGTAMVWQAQRMQLVGICELQGIEQREAIGFREAELWAHTVLLHRYALVGFAVLDQERTSRREVYTEEECRTRGAIMDAEAQERILVTFTANHLWSFAGAVIRPQACEWELLVADACSSLHSVSARQLQTQQRMQWGLHYVEAQCDHLRLVYARTEREQRLLTSEARGREGLWIVRGQWMRACESICALGHRRMVEHAALLSNERAQRDQLECVILLELEFRLRQQLHLHVYLRLRDVHRSYLLQSQEGMLRGAHSSDECRARQGVVHLCRGRTAILHLNAEERADRVVEEKLWQQYITLAYMQHWEVEGRYCVDAEEAGDWFLCMQSERTHHARAALASAESSARQQETWLELDQRRVVEEVMVEVLQQLVARKARLLQEVDGVYVHSARPEPVSVCEYCSTPEGALQMEEAERMELEGWQRSMRHALAHYWRMEGLALQRHPASPSEAIIPRPPTTPNGSFYVATPPGSAKRLARLVAPPRDASTAPTRSPFTFKAPTGGTTYRKSKTAGMPVGSPLSVVHWSA